MIRESLAKDRNDHAKLRHGVEVHEGTLPGSYANLFYPHFFTREGATLAFNGLYRGAAAFLIGGGPSFAAVDQTRLREVWSMTLNNASASYRGQASCIVDDPSRFSLSLWLDPRVQKFIPLAHFEKPLWDNRLLDRPAGLEQVWQRSPLRLGDCPNVIGYRRNEKFHAPRWLHEDTVNWGNHAKYGGGRSVMLAALRILYLLGFRKVFLLGVDFEMSGERKYHFSETRDLRSIRGNNLTYVMLQRHFAELQPYFLREGYIVKNCNPHSRLTAFPMIPFEEAISEATAELGHYGSERTHGMYTKLEEKTAAGPGAVKAPGREPV